MLEILAITGPIFITMGLGFATTRLGLFTKADLRAFGKFVINIALPALLFNALSQRALGEILNGSYLLAYLAGSLIVLGLGYVWALRVMRLNLTQATFHVMGMTCANSGFMGYPILLLTLAPIAGVALALNLVVENVIMIPLLLVLAEYGRGTSGHWHEVVRQAFVRLLSNPLIIGLAAGFTVSMLGWTLPEPLTRTVNLLAMASGALSLFVIGGTLVGLPMHGMGARTLPIVIGKLILHPLAVLSMVLLVPVAGLTPMDPSLRMGAVLMAAMPMLSVYPILAQAYGEEDLAAAALLVTTVASFVTISGMLWLLKHVPL